MATATAESGFRLAAPPPGPLDLWRLPAGGIRPPAAARVQAPGIVIVRPKLILIYFQRALRWQMALTIDISWVDNPLYGCYL
jgi:hypothetical protein